MEYKPDVVQKAKFEYSPLGKVFNKGLDEKDQLDEIKEQGEKQIDVIKEQGKRNQKSTEKTSRKTRDGREIRKDCFVKRQLR